MLKDALHVVVVGIRSVGSFVRTVRWRRKMAQKLICISKNDDCTFLPSDDTIHKLAVEAILGKEAREKIYKQKEYAYKIKGGEDGHLYYKKGGSGSWILVANWYSYGFYLTVRYRKSPWLRAFYERLFEKMEFFSVDFCTDGFELLRTDGTMLKGRKLNLSPPGYFEKYLAENFRLRPKDIGEIRSKLNIKWVL